MKFILLKQFTIVNIKLKVGIEVGHSIQYSWPTLKNFNLK